MLLCALSALLTAVPVSTGPVPTLGKEPKIDGDLRDLAPSQTYKTPEKSLPRLALKAGFRKDTLFVGITVTDHKILEADQLDLTLYFPDSGVTSRGVVYRFGKEGLRAAPPEIGAPAFAQRLVKSAVQINPTGYSLEIALPARALPRFKASGPLALSLCVDYADASGDEPTKVTSCPTGEMLGGPTRLPDELRKNLKLAPSADVEGIEARAQGWLGYSKLHFPTWAVADEPLTAESLVDLIAGDAAIAPASVAMPTPRLSLEGRPIYMLLTGRNPYIKDTCVSDNELRMALYIASGNTAKSVLEWPAVNCKLGKAMRIELTAEGSLEIGYTSGATHYFTWTVDHFERSELGLLQYSPY